MRNTTFKKDIYCVQLLMKSLIIHSHLIVIDSRISACKITLSLEIDSKVSER